MRRYGICFFINLFVCVAAKSQEIPLVKSPVKQAATGSFQPNISLTLVDTLPVFNQRITAIPASFYTSNIGFFCKKELQVEKVLKLPVKFRLGSVAYTDKMEGKGSGILQHP